MIAYSLLHTGGQESCKHAAASIISLEVPGLRAIMRPSARVPYRGPLISSSAVTSRRFIRRNLKAFFYLFEDFVMETLFLAELGNMQSK